MKRQRKILIVLLAVLMLCQLAMPVSAAGNKYFSDVSAGDWYEDEINAIMDAQAMMGSNNIIGGYADENGKPTGKFGPNDPLNRAQFLKMILEAFSVTGSSIDLSDRSMDSVHWAGKYYQAAKKDNLLVADVYESTELLFPCTWAEMEKPVTRAEMAVILANLLTNVGMDSVVVINGAEDYIKDYASLGNRFKSAVEQVWGKKLITGYTDGNFGGSRTLTRAEGVTVVYRFLFQYNINGNDLAEFASRPGEADKGESLNGRPAGFQSFAEWLRSGHVDAWGKIDNEARTRLFGNPNKSYFTSAAEAAPYMADVTIPIWTMDKTGNKFSSSMVVTVNKAVAQEVQLIFQQIYNDPEKFPIYGGWSVGGARFTDTMRHAWGCAIDVNALYNCECNLKSGYLRVTCGYGWWPVGHADGSFAGSMTGPSYYSIGKNPGEYGYSVVKAFSDYGWGWGGKGWSGGLSFDYMHFSVLPSGG